MEFEMRRKGKSEEAREFAKRIMKM